jgi:hypothetical protein
MGIPLVVEQPERAIRAPNVIGQTRVRGMARIEAPVGTHRVGAIVRIVVHEVVRGQSYDAAEEVTASPFVVNIVR